MKVPKELIEKWWDDSPYDQLESAKYIAQRAADYALEQAASVAEKFDVCNVAFSIRNLKEVK